VLLVEEGKANPKEPSSKQRTGRGPSGRIVKLKCDGWNALRRGRRGKKTKVLNSFIRQKGKARLKREQKKTGTKRKALHALN